MAITIYQYDAQGGWDRLTPERIQLLYQAFSSSPLYGDEPERFGFVKTGLYEGDTVYGFFVQQYRRVRSDYDDQKNGFLTEEDDFAHYLFIYQPNLHILLLQRRRSHQQGPPPWATIFDRFQDLFRLVITQANLYPPREVTEAKRGNSRAEFLDLFNRPSARVTYINVMDLDTNLLPSDFQFFNPHREFDEVWNFGIRRTAENTKSITMEAMDAGNLSRTPDAKGFMQMAQHPQYMRVILSEHQQETILEAEREVKLELELPVIEGESVISADEVARILGAVSRRERIRNRPRRVQGGQLQLFDQMSPSNDDSQ